MQLIIIIGLIFVVILSNSDSQSKDSLKDNSIITDLNQSSFNRISEVVHRYNEGKGDNIMIILPTMDSGPWIHDIFSNGREIYWIVDNTRDGMSAPTGKTEYKCKEIQMEETKEYFVIELSKCKNYKDEEKIPIFSVKKDEL